jgi:hypothetical protein
MNVHIAVGDQALHYALTLLILSLLCSERMEDKAF